MNRILVESMTWSMPKNLWLSIRDLGKAVRKEDEAAQKSAGTDFNRRLDTLYHVVR